MSMKKQPQLSITGSHFTPEMRTLSQICELSNQQYKQASVDFKTFLSKEDPLPLVKVGDTQLISEPCIMYTQVARFLQLQQLYSPPDLDSMLQFIATKLTRCTHRLIRLRLLRVQQCRSKEYPEGNIPPALQEEEQLERDIFYQHLLPKVNQHLRDHEKLYVCSTDKVSLADFALYHEIIQVLSVLAVTDVLFTVDTSSEPVLVVKNVDISTYPQLNNWMYRMSKQKGTSQAIENLEKEMKELRQLVIKS